MTVSQAWSYGAPEGDTFFYCQVMGDADWQPTTGNVVMVHGMLSSPTGVYAEIWEVTPDGRRVFRLVLGNPEGGSAFTMYRADRIADIRD